MITFSTLEFLAATALCTSIILLLCALLQRTRTQRNNAVWEAAHDPLTGLLTRRAFEQRAHTLLNTGSYACVFLDLNHFKLLNDICGHDVGDAILQKTARVLTTHLPSTALIGRRGGDEFTVLIPIPNTVPAKKHEAWIDELLAPAVFQCQRLYCIPEKNVWVTAATGIHTGPLTCHALLSLMYRRADAAMYDAKRAGLTSVHWKYKRMSPKQRESRPRYRLRDRHRCHHCGCHNKPHAH